jgi:hypothetical protein
MTEPALTAAKNKRLAAVRDFIMTVAEKVRTLKVVKKPKETMLYRRLRGC